MTLTLELPLAEKSGLQELPARNGQKPEEYALRRLEEVSLAEKNEFDAAVAGTRRGMADAAAGREISLEDYLAEIAR